MPLFTKKEVKLREGKSLVQGHTAGDQAKMGIDHVLSDPKPSAFSPLGVSSLIRAQGVNEVKVVNSW